MRKYLPLLVLVAAFIDPDVARALAPGSSLSRSPEVETKPNPTFQAGAGPQNSVLFSPSQTNAIPTESGTASSTYSRQHTRQPTIFDRVSESSIDIDDGLEGMELSDFLEPGDLAQGEDPGLRKRNLKPTPSEGSSQVGTKTASSIQTPSANNIGPAATRDLESGGGLEPVEMEEDKYAPHHENCAKNCATSCASYTFGCLACNAQQKTYLKADKDFCCNKNWCKPTLRRVVGCGLLSSVYAGGITLLVKFGPGVFASWMNTFTGYLLINGYETILNTAALIWSKPDVAPKTSKERLKQIAIVIPVYGKEKQIKRTLDSMIAYGLEPDQLFVVENTAGRYKPTESTTFNLLTKDAAYRGVNHLYTDAWGNKAGAQYMGTAAAKLGITRANINRLKDKLWEQRRKAHSRADLLDKTDILVRDLDESLTEAEQKMKLEEPALSETEALEKLLVENEAYKRYKYTALVDDDTILTPDFDFRLSMLKKDVTMVSFEITAGNENQNWLVEQQAAEYKKAWRNNKFRWRLGTVFYPHGAIMVAKTDALLNNFSGRPITGVFMGDDHRMGIRFRWAGGRIAAGSGPAIKTEVPETLSMYWSQRVRFWDQSAHLLGPEYLEDFLTDCLTDCSINGLLKFAGRKIYQFQTVLSLFSDVARPLLLVSFVTSPAYWETVAVVYEINAIVNVLDDVLYTPHYRNQPVCVGADLLRSCRTHQTNFLYSALQMANGSMSACCAYIGSGAADPKDFPMNKPFPPEIRVILDIEDVETRETHLRNYILNNLLVMLGEEGQVLPPPALRMHDGFKDLLPSEGSQPAQLKME